MSALVLLAQAGVGEGMISGGWSYVWASYAIAYGSIALYSLALWRRYRSSSATAGPEGKE